MEVVASIIVLVVASLFYVNGLGRDDKAKKARRARQRNAQQPADLCIDEVLSGPLLALDAPVPNLARVVAVDDRFVFDARASDTSRVVAIELERAGGIDGVTTINEHGFEPAGDVDGRAYQVESAHDGAGDDDD